jgi:hypothetical protein
LGYEFDFWKPSSCSQLILMIAKGHLLETDSKTEFRDGLDL